MHKYKATSINIVDGDTQDYAVDLGFNIYHQIRVRLNGINTPESRTRDLKEKVLYLLIMYCQTEASMKT